MSNVHKFKEPVLAPAYLLLDGSTVGAGEVPSLSPGSGGDAVTVTSPGLVKISATFDLAFTVLSTSDFATFPIVERPNSNLLILGCRLTIDGTKTNSFSINFAVGAAAMASSSLAAGNTDVLTSSGSLYNGTTGAFPTYDANGVDDGSNAPPRLIAADADEFFHLNIQHVVNSNSDVTLTGTLEIIYLDMGGPAA